MFIFIFNNDREKKKIVNNLWEIILFTKKEFQNQWTHLVPKSWFNKYNCPLEESGTLRGKRERERERENGKRKMEKGKGKENENKKEKEKKADAKPRIS